MCDLRREMKYISLILILFRYIIADSISDKNALKEFLNMQSKIKFGTQQRACATCDWSVSYPLESSVQNLDSINIDSINTQNAQNPQNLISPKEAKNMQQVLQYSAMQDLFDSDGVESEDSVNYEFLGQRGGANYIDNLDSNDSLFKNPLNTRSPQNASSLDSTSAQITQHIKLTKATFMKRDINSAYQQILQHKGVITCMYCGDLDKVAQSLPTAYKDAKYHNVSYTFAPTFSDAGNKNAMYRIDIADSVCGVVDSLIFIADSLGVQLFVYSRTRCRG